MLKKLNQAAFYIFIFIFVFGGNPLFSLADESLPDFTIDRLYLPANNQYAGSPFNAQDMQATIKNLAGQAANEVKLDFLISNNNNEIVCQGQGKTIGLFNAWGEKEYTLDRNEFINCPDLTAGDYKLKAMADYGDKITETKEDNNFKEVSFTVKPSASAPAISSQEVSVSGTSERRISFSYYLSQFSNNSVVEYATEDFFGSQKKYDLTINPTMLAGYYFYAVASTTESVAYRWRIKMQDSNIQSKGQIFVLMPEDKNPWLNALSFKNLLEVQAVADTSAKIVWQTNKDSSTKVSYEVNNYLVNGTTVKTKENSGDSVKTHAIELTGLLPNTHYYYKIESTSGAETVSFISHFYTNGSMYQAAAPLISNLAVSNIATSSVEVNWTTDINSSTKITYEANNAALDGSNAKIIDKSETVTSHQLNLSNLEPNTKYYYKIESVVSGRKTETSGDFSTLKLTETPSCAKISSVNFGDLIMTAGVSSVYYYGRNCKRYVFPNEKIYFTWYQDFTGIKVISGEELADIPIGGNVSYRPGVKMVKITTSPVVYAVAKNGVLRSVKNESIAKELYGEDWNKKIDDIPDAFFTDYVIGAELNGALDYSIATLQTESADINADKGL